MYRRLYRYLSVLVLVALLFTGTGCGQIAPGQSDASATPTPLPPPVAPELPTYVVSRGTVVKSVELTGRVSPILEENLGFEVAGRVKAVYVDRGDFVEKGTLLGELENDEILSQLAQAQIDLDNANNNLSSAIASREYAIRQAEINLTIKQLELARLRESTLDQDLAIQQASLQKAEAALKQAQANYDRRASQPGYESSPEALGLEQATLNYQIAQANFAKTVTASQQYSLDLRIKEQQIALSELGLEQLRAEIDPKLVNAVERAQLSVDQVQARVDRTRIYGTIDGVVTAAAPNVGANVTAYKTQFIIADNSELEITTDPGSTDVSEMWEGMPVSVVFASSPQNEYTATVRQMPYPYGTSGSEDLAQDDKLIHIEMDLAALNIKSGAGCTITAVIEEHEDALWLPPIALREFSGRYFVLVEENGVERRADIEPGIVSSDRIEILSGLEEGQIVLGQ